MIWRERKAMDPALRLIGLVLLCVALLVGRHLFARADLHARDEPTAYLLALIEIASTSAGAALTILGRHLFDRVDLPARWIIHEPAREKQ